MNYNRVNYGKKQNREEPYTTKVSYFLSDTMQSAICNISLVDIIN